MSHGKVRRVSKLHSSFSQIAASCFLADESGRSVMEFREVTDGWLPLKSFTAGYTSRCRPAT